MKLLITPEQIEFDADLQIVEDYDNLFRLTRYDSLIAEASLVVVAGLNCNRFYEHTLKEILARVRVDQRVAFFTHDNQHLTWFGLKSAIEKLFPSQFALLNQHHEGNGSWLTLWKRVAPAPAHHTDPHTGWTFGVLTLGKRLDAVQRLIDSIHQGIPEPYEILAVVPRRLPELAGQKGVRQIVSTEKDDLGWITRKKNLIAREARFSDLLICHDRYHLSPGFAQDFAYWGYDYAIAAPRVRLARDGRRATDWAVVTSENHTWSRGGALHYRAHSAYAYCPGGVTLIRKAAWQRFPWNENLFWNEHEDVELIRRLQRSGEILRLAGATVLADEDRWIDQNPPLAFDPEHEVLQGPPTGELRINWL